MSGQAESINLIQRQPESQDDQGDCSGWERDCESFCHSTAKQYWVDIDGVQPPLVKKIDCKMAGGSQQAMCIVTFDGGLAVSVAKIGPGTLELWRMRPGKPRGSYVGPACKYKYHCTAKNNLLVLERISCEEFQPQVPKSEQDESKESSPLQRYPAHQSESSQPPKSVYEVLNSPGQSLAPATRAFMESRFGRDFSQVRVHSDAAAVAAANAVNAKAFTVRNAIVFGAGQYSPAFSEGRRLLAHELTHVVQQGQFSVPAIQRKPESPVEEEAKIDVRYYASAQALSNIQQKISACQQQTKLGQTKITPQSSINPKTTPQVLDEVMERAAVCGSLSQYITLKPQKLSQGHFAAPKHYRGNEYLSSNPSDRDRTRYNFDTDEYHVQVMKYLGYDPKSLTDQQRAEIGKIGGFYDRTNDVVNVPLTGTFGNALHESVHRLSGLKFRGLYGSYLNEGVTQYFTNMIIKDEKLPPHTGHSYGPNLIDAELLINKIGGWELVAQLYFQQLDDAHWKILTHLGLPPISTDAQKLKAIRAVPKATKTP
jgi:hypothetical protein